MAVTTTTTTYVQLPLRRQPVLTLQQLIDDIAQTPWVFHDLQLDEWGTQWHPTDRTRQSYALGILILRLQSLARQAPSIHKDQIASWGESLFAFLSPLLQKEDLFEFLNSCAERLAYIAKLKAECDETEKMFIDIERTIHSGVTQAHGQMNARVEEAFSALNNERRVFHTALVEGQQALDRLYHQIHANAEEAARVSAEFNAAQANLQNLIAQANALLGGV